MFAVQVFFLDHTCCHPAVQHPLLACTHTRKPDEKISSRINNAHQESISIAFQLFNFYLLHCIASETIGGSFGGKIWEFGFAQRASEGSLWLVVDDVMCDVIGS